MHDLKFQWFKDEEYRLVSRLPDSYTPLYVIDIYDRAALNKELNAGLLID